MDGHQSFRLVVFLREFRVVCGNLFAQGEEVDKPGDPKHLARKEEEDAYPVFFKVELVRAYGPEEKPQKVRDEFGLRAAVFEVLAEDEKEQH